MSVEDERPTASVGRGAYVWTSHDLAALDALVDRVRRDPTDLALELELELETAREELRVADEEMRVQRDQLDELLQLSRARTAQRRRVASLLPVPMVTLDGAGRITEANAAAAALVNVPLVRLVGKPLVSFVLDADRGLVRSSLSEAAMDPLRVGLRLSPRRSSPVPVDLVLTPGVDADARKQVECTLLVQADASARAVDPVRLAAAVTEISRLAVGDHDPRRLLAGIARTSAGVLGDGVWASANLGHPAEPTQLASSDEAAAVVDGLQVRTGEGPCVDAFEEQETVLVDDVAAQSRWPRLRAVWERSPATAVLAVPVVAGGEKVGCLNIYSAAAGTFTEAQAQAAEVLALAGGAALEAVAETTRLREVAAQLDQAMTSRAVIDQAKGIIMARRGGTAEEAFAHLAALSQQRNVKVRDLARALVVQTETAAGVSRRRS